MQYSTIFWCLFAAFCGFTLAQDLFPTFPNQFSTSVEVNIVNKQYTTRRNEFYDYEGNRMRVDRYRENETISEIYDFNTGLRYEIRDWTHCTTQPIEENNPVEDPETHHLRNVSSFFRLSNEYRNQSSYQGVEAVRGIDCDKWEAPIIDERGNNYTLQWYFSVPSWEIQEGHQLEHAVPIRCSIEGTNSDNETFYHIYEFVFFSLEIPHRWVFDIPENFFCAHHEQPSLPELAPQFETAIEVNILNKNYTATVYEYIDTINGNLRFEFHRHNHSVVQIFNRDEGRRIEIEDHYKCNITDYNTTSDSSRVFSTSELFHFGSQFNETYLGLRVARGIPCDVWVSQVSHNTERGLSEYSLLWYFSTDDWEMRAGNGHGHRIPVRAEIRGTHTREDEEPEAFHHLYEFVNFIPTLPRYDVFRIPERVRCGSSQEGPQLPVLPNQFNTAVEFTIVEKNYTAVMREVYDYPNHRARFDFFGPQGHIILIESVEEDILLTIVDGQCKESILSERPIPIGNVDENGHLRKSADFFSFGEQYGEVYQGVRHLRGIPCDHWTSHINHTEGEVSFSYTLDYYFSPDGWTMRAHSSQAAPNRIPVRAEMRGTVTFANGTVTPMHHYYDFVDFNFGVAEESLFIPRPEWGCPHDKVPPVIPTSPTSSAAQVPNDDDGDDDDDDGKVSAGGAVALTLIALAVGGVVGVGATFFILKRKAVVTGSAASGPRTENIELEG